MRCQVYRNSWGPYGAFCAQMVLRVEFPDSSGCPGTPRCAKLALDLGSSHIVLGKVGIPPVTATHSSLGRLPYFLKFENHYEGSSGKGMVAEPIRASLLPCLAQARLCNTEGRREVQARNKPWCWEWAVDLAQSWLRCTWCMEGKSQGWSEARGWELYIVL